jgi:hypothetical protein
MNDTGTVRVTLGVTRSHWERGSCTWCESRLRAGKTLKWAQLLHFLPKSVLAMFSKIKPGRICPAIVLLQLRSHSQQTEMPRSSR